MKNSNDLITKAQSIITMGEEVLATETKGFQHQTFVDEQKFHTFRISGLSFLSRVFGNNSQHYQSFKTEVTSPGTSRTNRGIGILLAATNELNNNWLETTKGKITSEMLIDFLTMAKGHLEEGNPRNAVVLIGAVIEKHLNNLCRANNIETTNKLQKTATPKKPIQLTGEAYKKKLYDRQQNKKIISWLKLCNSDDQTIQTDISIKEIQNMCVDVAVFVANSPY